MADAFEEFRNTCLKIYGLDPAKFISAAGLAWQIALRKNKVKLDLLTDIDKLLIVQKCISHSLYRHEKANNKYMKYYDKN